MVTISKAAGRIAFAAVITAVSGLAVSGAYAGQFNSQVAVPIHPDVAVPAPLPMSWADGCYVVNGSLYGPYNMSFCIDGGQGTYRVRGGGLDCRGDVDSNAYGLRVDIALSASRCGRGMAWTADTLACQVNAVPGGTGGGWRGNTGGGYGGNFPGIRGGVSSQVAVPDVAVPINPGPAPRYGTSLRCTYQPAAYGYPNTVVTAERVS